MARSFSLFFPFPFLYFCNSDKASEKANCNTTTAQDETPPPVGGHG
jgi:hypothetical protein